MRLDDLRVLAQRNIAVGIFEDGFHVRRPGDIEVRERGIRAVVHHNSILSCSIAAFWQAIGARGRGARARVNAQPCQTGMELPTSSNE
jgi:hypothetical protein